MSISDATIEALANRDGAAGVEFALMLPTLVLFIIGTVDLGSLAYQKAEVSAAVNAGALYAIANAPSPNLTSVATAVTSATPLTVSASPAPTQGYYCETGGSLTSVASLTSPCSGGQVGTYVQVNATATYAPLISWGSLTMPSTLSAQAMVRIQ